MALRDRHCVPCAGGVPGLDAAAIAALQPEVPQWQVTAHRLHREFVFPDFAAAMAFVNRMAALAEAEDHHPDFCVHYRRVAVTLWTHAAGGLTENDFVLAAKLDAL